MCSAGRSMEIAAVVPALRDDFTIEPLFVRESHRRPAAVDGRASGVARRRASTGVRADASAATVVLAARSSVA